MRKNEEPGSMGLVNSHFCIHILFFILINEEENLYLIPTYGVPIF